MNQIILELPPSLHQQLHKLATRNNMSINQYVLENLKQIAAYRIIVIPEDDIAQQEKSFHALRQRLGYTASVAEAQEILKQTREPSEIEPGLTAELRQQFEKKMRL